MREKRLDNRKSGWVLLSQIVLVPVYVIFYALSKALDGILFAFGKAMDGVGAFFRRTFLWIKGLFVRGERREKSRPVREKSPGARRAGEICLLILKILMLVAFSPMLAVLAVCFVVYLVFFGFAWCLKKLFPRGEGVRAQKRREEKSRREAEEPLWKRDFRYRIYAVKTGILNYFEENICIFRKREHVNVGARKKRELRFIVLMLLLPVAQFLVFWLYVNFNSILMAFRLEQGGEYVYTFHNFNRFFVELKAAGGTMWTQIKNSLSFFPVSVCVTLPLSFVFSYFLYKKVPGTGLFRVLFYLPSIMSAVSLTMLFRYTISPVGPLAVLERAIGIEPIDFLGSPKYAMGTILFYTVWSGLGYNIVLISSQMARIPKELFESAAIDGAGLMTEMLSIVLPLSYGTISTLITLSIAHLFTTIGSVILLTNGANNTNTIASFIYYKVKNSSENNMAYASAVGLVFTFVGLPIVLLGRKLLSMIGENIEF